MASTQPAQSSSPAYPVGLQIDFPNRQLNRLTSFFRIFTAIPIFIIIASLTGAFGGPQWHTAAHETGRYMSYGMATGGILFCAVLLMLLFRKKYPKWWFDWNYSLVKFCARVSSYLLLLRDEYPSTDEDQAVHVQMEYPDAQKLMRGMPIVKWFLAIPHYFVLLFLGIAACFCVFIAWWAILFTGRYPKSFWEFVVGVMRWSLRVEGYAMLLVTDQYPPFTLQ